MKKITKNINILFTVNNIGMNDGIEITKKVGGGYTESMRFSNDEAIAIREYLNGLELIGEQG